MIRNYLLLFWLCGILFISTITFGIWAVQQTMRVASLTADLASSVAELTSTKAANKAALSKQKATLKAKARLRRGLVAVPVLGAGFVLYFEEQDFQEWLTENPDGDRAKYACEVATYSAELVDEIVFDTLQAARDLPDYLQPDAEKVKSWLTIPKCLVSDRD
jgi:hypothetical protein